jgi:glycosyltransferase involved in cell wall biosynthesis
MGAVIVTTHAIQYQAPLFRLLARRLDLDVVFMMRQTPKGQAASGFGVEFEWDTPLVGGYRHVFANNVAASPSSSHRNGIVLNGHESLLSSLRPHVLMTMGWFPRGYLQVVRWAKRMKVPLVCRGESNLLSGGSLVKRISKLFYFPRFFRQFDAFAVIGRRNREFYRHYGVPEEKLHDAPYSIDTPFFENAFARHRAPVRKPGPWRIGFAGKLITKKRPIDLVSAATVCKSKSRIQLVIIGDGPLRPTLDALARKSRIDIEFRGFLNQSEIVPRGYADLDAIVLPSGENETWGLVINEAMTGGIPAIVSDMVGCAPDLIEPDQTGYVFESGKTNQLAQSIDRLVARLESGHDFAPAVRAQISKYSLEKTVDGVVEALHDAIAA